MTDWRTKPRTGKSEFYPLIEEISKRLRLGETYKQIHTDLITNKRITIGYHQFAKYINQAFQAKEKPSEKRKALPSNSFAPTANAFAHLAERTDKRRDADDSFHSSVPNKNKIYGSE